ncbi:hypothetical protein LP420_02480 [Massilia sp. B-10]|nr:hypothetical protein LP420_02480 [Massilia sp. B-10]
MFKMFLSGSRPSCWRLSPCWAVFYSGEFPQASHAESTGFDALAHNLFADVLGPDDEAESK